MLSLIENIGLRKVLGRKFEVAQNCTKTNFVNYNSHYIVGNKIKKGEMGRACNTKTLKEMCIHNLVKTPVGERTLQNPKLRRRSNINMDLKNRTEYYRWLSSGSRGEKMSTVLNTIMNTKLHRMIGFFLTR
jgi:hypothetical protein